MAEQQRFNEGLFEQYAIPRYQRALLNADLTGRMEFGEGGWQVDKRAERPFEIALTKLAAMVLPADREVIVEPLDDQPFASGGGPLPYYATFYEVPAGAGEVEYHLDSSEVESKTQTMVEYIKEAAIKALQQSYGTEAFRSLYYQPEYDGSFDEEILTVMREALADPQKFEDSYAQRISDRRRWAEEDAHRRATTRRTVTPVNA